jgi:hypothetical protein
MIYVVVVQNALNEYQRENVILIGIFRGELLLIRRILSSLYLSTATTKDLMTLIVPIPFKRAH